MIEISNKSHLIENGKTPLIQKARMLALNSLERALNAAEPRSLLQSKLTLKGSCLRADNCSFDLTRIGQVYVVGGGKAGGAMALALEEILGNCISAGVVNVPYGAKRQTQVIELNEASHPVPDGAGEEGARRMMALAKIAEKDDLLICVLSGGGSSLMPLPREGISIRDKQKLTDALLKSGAAIGEINVVRKHLSALKGGWLAKKAYPATVLNLLLSDVMGDSLDAIASGPTVPDPSTFADARRILEKYNLWSDASDSIRKLLSDGELGLAEETPKPGEAAFKRVCNVIVGNNKISSDAAVTFLKSASLNTLLFQNALTGEAREGGKRLALFACRIAASGRPLSKPAGVVAGGETTVTVTGKGKGGRNQELALAAALQFENSGACVLASIGTDGVDGSTDAAGAIVDGFTLARARELGLDPGRYLTDNNSYDFFSQLGDLIVTGATGTNVNDISVIVIL